VALVENEHRVFKGQVNLVSQVLVYQIVVGEDGQVAVGDAGTHQVVGAAVVDLTQLSVVCHGEGGVPGQLRSHVIQ
jgi:hypothetical protein